MGHEKETHFFVFLSKFSFLRFLWAFFDFFPYVTLLHFWFQATGHSFSHRNVLFGLKKPMTGSENKNLLVFYKEKIEKCQ